MTLRSCLLSSLLGTALILLAPTGAAAGNWSATMEKVLAPGKSEPTVFTIESKGLIEGSHLWPLTVQVTRTTVSGDPAGVAVDVIEPFDIRGSTYWVKPSSDGEPEVWTYIPALRRVRKVADDSWLHPGIRTVMQMETLARSLDWDEARVEREDGYVRLVQEVPGACGRLEATIDPEREIARRIEFSQVDGEPCATLEFEMYQRVAGELVPSRVDLALWQEPELDVALRERGA